MSRFEVSSKDSCARASWFCKGVVRKTKLPYLLKKKEMIMPGIMSEGSAISSGPRCEGQRESRFPLPDVWDYAPPQEGFLRWRGTAGHRAASGFAAGGGRAAAAG